MKMFDIYELPANKYYMYQYFWLVLGNLRVLFEYLQLTLDESLFVLLEVRCEVVIDIHPLDFFVRLALEGFLDLLFGDVCEFRDVGDLIYGLALIRNGQKPVIAPLPNHKVQLVVVILLLIDLFG